MGSYDVVVRGGTLIDGTGAPGRSADVAIADGVIVEVGKVTGTARRTIDADGATVTPGFVDMHTHYDGQATWDNQLDALGMARRDDRRAWELRRGFAPVQSTIATG